MRKTGFALFLFMTFAITAMVAVARDGETKAVTNKMCPVMNAAVSANIRSEYKGQFVYFCCEGCKTMFAKDPETYVAKLSKEDQEAITANTVCPITNEKIPDQTKWVEDEGRKVYFCCDGCLSMYKEKMASKKAK